MAALLSERRGAEPARLASVIIIALPGRRQNLAPGMVTVVERPETIERSLGKMRRIIDNRPR